MKGLSEVIETIIIQYCVYNQKVYVPLVDLHAIPSGIRLYLRGRMCIHVHVLHAVDAIQVVFIMIYSLEEISEAVNVYSGQIITCYILY